MKIFKNKYFILGNITLLLITIPLILYFVKRQTNTQSHAAATTLLTFNPTAKTVGVGDNFDIIVSVNPNQNIVSIIDMYLQYDQTKLKLVTVTPNQTAFPTTLRGPIIASGSANMSLTTGVDVTKAVQTITNVATLTFQALATTDAGPTLVSFDGTQTRVFSLASSDQPGENVLQGSQLQPAAITIVPAGQLSITPSSSISPEVTPSTTITPPPGGPTPTSGPAAINQAPVCNTLVADRVLNGTAPYSLTFTGNGTDPDGTISKASFLFGDGAAQDVTTAGGIGTAHANVSTSHTYNNAGTFQATVSFMDNDNAESSASAACSQTVVVAAAPTSVPGGGSGDNGGSGNGGFVATATPIPSLAPTGNTTNTIAVLGGIIITIIGGAALLLL